MSRSRYTVYINVIFFCRRRAIVAFGQNWIFRAHCTNYLLIHDYYGVNVTLMLAALYIYRVALGAAYLKPGIYSRVKFYVFLLVVRHLLIVKLRETVHVN